MLKWHELNFYGIYYIAKERHPVVCMLDDAGSFLRITGYKTMFVLIIPVVSFEY